MFGGVELSGVRLGYVCVCVCVCETGIIVCVTSEES